MHGATMQKTSLEKSLKQNTINNYPSGTCATNYPCCASNFSVPTSFSSLHLNSILTMNDKAKFHGDVGLHCSNGWNRNMHPPHVLMDSTSADNHQHSNPLYCHVYPYKPASTANIASRPVQCPDSLYTRKTKMASKKHECTPEKKNMVNPYSHLRKPSTPKKTEQTSSFLPVYLPNISVPSCAPLNQTPYVCSNVDRRCTCACSMNAKTRECNVNFRGQPSKASFACVPNSQETNHPCRVMHDVNVCKQLKNTNELNSNNVMKEVNKTVPIESDTNKTSLSFENFSDYQLSTIDEILNITAQNVGLSPAEHCGLKMDLFRNFIRTYEALQDAIKREQLQSIIHPFLAELVIKHTHEFQQQILFQEEKDAPEMCPNVRDFLHGAIFINRAILISDTVAKILCTYALDVSKKISFSFLMRKICLLLEQNPSNIFVTHQGRVLDTTSQDTIQSFHIDNGSTLDVFLLEDPLEKKRPLSLLLDNPSLNVQTNISSIILQAKQKASKMNRLSFKNNLETLYESPWHQLRNYSSQISANELNSLSNPPYIPSMLDIEKLSRRYGIEKQDRDTLNNSELISTM